MILTCSFFSTFVQTGFSQGLSVGDDFNLDDLDPLKQ